MAGFFALSHTTAAVSHAAMGGEPPVLTLAACLVGALAAVLGYRRTRRDRATAAAERRRGEVLARWSFHDDAWRAWVAEEVARARNTRAGVVAVGAAIGGFFGGGWGSCIAPEWLPRGVVAGALLFAPLVWLAARGQSRRLVGLRHARPEVVVAESSVEIGGEEILWYRKVPWYGGYRLRWVRFEAAPHPRLLVALAYRRGGSGRGLFDRPTLHLPVPPGREGEAARLAYRLSPLQVSAQRKPNS